MSALNAELMDMKQRGQISPAKEKALLSLKEFMDRAAGCEFISEAEKARSLEKFGVLPDIITWGDYFQTEVASAHWEKSDKDFSLIVQTVIYDTIAGALIFSGKPDSFLQSVRRSYHEALGQQELGSTESIEEAIHLGLLLEYFEQMNLSLENLDKVDFDYFHQFAVGMAS